MITHPSTTTYPSVKGVWDFVETKSEQPRADIAQNKADIAILKANKVDNTDFNAYKTNNDTAVKKNATNIAQLDKSKANLVQSYNLFDWSILNGKTANGLTATATDDGGYHITGTPTKKYVSMLVKSIIRKWGVLHY